MEMLELKKVCYKAAGCEGNGQEIRDLDLSISSGESVYILCESGEVLTELVMLIGLVTRPDKGSIFIDSEDTGIMNMKEMAALRNRYFGYIGDSFPLIDGWNAIKNVEVPLMYSEEKPNATERRSRVRELLEAVGLSERARTKVGALTKSERLRVQIARAFVNNGKIILADKPLMNLEHGEDEQIMELIFKLSGKERILIMTGCVTLFSQRFSRRLILKDGTLLQEYWGKNDGMDERVCTICNGWL
jgi:putative ABC transport system ATP-binding protein